MSRSYQEYCYACGKDDARTQANDAWEVRQCLTCGACFKISVKPIKLETAGTNEEAWNNAIHEANRG